MTDPIEDLAALVKQARDQADGASQRPDSPQVIAFFDLTGSTSAKLSQGNAASSRNALTFTTLASLISTRCGGTVIKTLGDGALATFPNGRDACRAALHLRHATYELLDLEMTAGLTSGEPLRVELGDGTFDLLGDVVDRAARIQGLATPGQVLLDDTLFMQVRAYVAGTSGWLLDTEPRNAFAKGIGTLKLYELTLSKHWKPKKQLALPFTVDPGGRPSVAEKVALLQNAKTEIIEIGIGLTSFAQYFTGQQPSEFRDPIRTLVRGGVDLTCYALDPDYAPGAAWVQEQGNADYPTEAELAKNRIMGEIRYQRQENFRGKLRYRTYRRVPEFWCLGVDVDDPVDGRMFFTSYMMGLARASTPCVQVSRTSNSAMYDKFMTSIGVVREHAS